MENLHIIYKCFSSVFPDESNATSSWLPAHMAQKLITDSASQDFLVFIGSNGWNCDNTVQFQKEKH